MEVAGIITFTPLNVCVSYSPGMYFLGANLLQINKIKDPEA